MDLNPEGDPDAGLALFVLVVVACIVIACVGLKGKAVRDMSRDACPEAQVTK